MAAKDKVCNGEVAGLEELTFVSGFDKKFDTKSVCKDTKWIGPPDKEDELREGWGPDPCKGAMAMMSIMPFIWYFIVYLALYSYLLFNIWSYKEELVKVPTDDTEMGAAKPAVATATATATATTTATATPAVAVATAVATPNEA